LGVDCLKPGWQKKIPDRSLSGHEGRTRVQPKHYETENGNTNCGHHAAIGGILQHLQLHPLHIEVEVGRQRTVFLHAAYIYTRQHYDSRVSLRIVHTSEGELGGFLQEDAESFLGVGSQPQSGGSVPELPPPLQPALDSAYRGYGGWLAFFSVVQIFVVPIIALISGAVSISEVSKVSDRYPGLIAPTAVELIGDFALVGFGVYVGIALWRLRRGAVGIAKAYLVARLVWAVLKFALPYLGTGLPSQVIDAMWMEVGKELVQTVIAFAIWFSYFNVSKRIKATFPEG
jgi:Protein of unknown function (DUF2569)